MKRLALVLGMCGVLTSSAGAQELQTTISAGENGVELRGPKAGAEPNDDAEKKKAYDKRVGGIVWLEATAGPSRFDATRFRSLDIVPAEFAALIPSVVVSGPEFGAALRFRAGSSTIGARFKRADYDPFDMTSVGLDLGFLIRAVPYVHPSIRLGFNYYTTTGGLVIPGVENLISNVRSHGGGASIGAGLRIPIVRWISIAADFDYSIIGLVFRGTETVTGSGATVTAGTAGTAIAGTFALTFHLGG
ncbi:MAG: hypothetical protein JRE81_01250 [Deltaproteobacteria bacterium]|jgi:hypothetical protein|nr:hypothetical protein [Deltaproteobacteria bacterium]